MRTKIYNFLQSNAIQTIMMVFTFWALYVEDFKIAYAHPDLDETFGIIAFIVFLAFMAELFLSCYAVENYYLSFFFWLDLIAVVSLVFDIEFLMRDTGLSGGGANEARAGRAARAGTKAGRIVRLVRLIRITAVLNLCFKKNEEEIQKEKDPEDDKAYEPTKLGSFLSSMITHKVIVAVLLTMTILPMLQAADRDENGEITPLVNRLSSFITTVCFSLKQQKKLHIL